ncbi:hypothetical protein [Fluviispira multicolorata]|uniref:AAA domain-containing protein n=1 Tax=Fluviispira multicolorata TaxID=2654512 RepID=A0A833JEL0_9BACT|nr:hypothetical protein [Fluviispira multicolorata]KAB8032117.1 hypothetical protein GCL57_05575 [Fluviispira multicolorata]
MRIIFISGDGHGAGKTYLAKRIASGSHQMYSIANMIRKELEKIYPKYDWYNKSPSFKDNTIVKETGKSVHQMLDDLGKEKKSKNNIYWAKQIVELIQYGRDTDKLDLAIIDDIRLIDEYLYIKSQFQKEHITHFHVVNHSAKPEPMYQNLELRNQADYHILSRIVLSTTHS